MIKATKGLSPILVHHFDNAEACVYNLTAAQYDIICESNEDPTDALEQFEIKSAGMGVGYIPDYMLILSEILGFEVDSI